MHELSLAQSILELAKQHVPPGNSLRGVRVAAGPLRGIDPLCMQAAFNAVARQRLLHGVKLELQNLPWSIRCDDCQRSWETDDLPESCACGSKRVRPVGGDELQLVSIEVDEFEPARNAS